jgi:hypothetical protein
MAYGSVAYGDMAYGDVAYGSVRDRIARFSQHKTPLYSPASDPTNEVMYFGHQRVVTRKKNNG